MRTLSFIAIALMLFGCGAPENTALKWPALKTLDHEVEELDGLLAGEPDPAALAEHLPHVREALESVLKDGVPPDADHPERVEQKLEELRALAADLGNDPDVLKALHPLVASIMETAGMPHVHDEHDHNHGHDHDHDHGDPDHDHDH